MILSASRSIATRDPRGGAPGPPARITSRVKILPSARGTRMADGRVMVRAYLDLHTACRQYYEIALTRGQAVRLARDLLDAGVSDPFENVLA